MKAHLGCLQASQKLVGLGAFRSCDVLITSPFSNQSYSSLQEHLLKEGLAWLDLQAPGEAHYWLPALFTDLYSQEISAEEAREAFP